MSSCSFFVEGKQNFTKQKINIMSCGCGRSPTGECIGWHSLTEEEYQKKLKEYKANSKS